MRISFSTGCLIAYRWPMIFAIAREIGAGGLEFMLRPVGEPPSPAEIKSLASEFGVPVLSVHPPVMLRSKGPDHFRPYEDAVRIALEIPTAETVVFHMPRSPYRESGYGRLWYDMFDRCRKMVEGSHVRIALENRSLSYKVRQFKHEYDDPVEIHRFARESGVAVTYDICHAATTGRSVVETYKAVEDLVADIHFSDMKAFPLPVKSTLFHSLVKQHQMPGHGCLPLRLFLEHLRSSGYSGPVTYELSPLAIRGWSYHTAKRKLQEAVEFCRNN